MYPRTLSRVYNRVGSGMPQSLDLYEDFALADYIVYAMTLIIRGTMTSTGGGAISGFHRDAPAGMILNAKCYGQYVPTGKLRTIFDAPPQQLYYPGNFSQGVLQALLRTSGGAASTDPFRAVIPVPLRDPRFKRAGLAYIDVRDYSSLFLDIKNWETDANLATTNLSTVQAVELEVVLDVIEKGPAKGTPHFEPSLAYKELPLATASTMLTDSGQVNWDGFATALWIQTFDASAAGDAQRVNGTLRFLQATQGGRALIDLKRFDAMLRETWSKYNPSLTTTEVAGVAGTPLTPPWDGRLGPAVVRRDTASAVPPGITAVAPAAGDTLQTLIVAADSVFGAERAV